MKKYKYSDVYLSEIQSPKCDNDGIPIFLSDETMRERKNKILNLMKEQALDCIIVYNDLEHGSNFEYLTGFLTRFEEGLLVLHRDEKAYLILGNENTKMVNYSRIPAGLIHSPYFSLPNQPMENELTMKEVFKKAGINQEMKVGLVGWKNFTSKYFDNRKIFDIPYYIVEGVKEIVGEDNISNASHIFINSDYGARAINNANEVAHYEFGSSLASDCVLNAMDALEIGKTEMEIGSLLKIYGQPNNVVSISATGNRFEKANLYAINKKIELGDKISLTTGYKGGLASRAGYAVNETDELSEQVNDYINIIAAPYFTSIVAWLENIHIGMTGEEMYGLVDKVLPKNQFNWSLNPGHLTADEEWMSSPIYPNSKETLKSGMLLQIDIIPSIPGYGGVGAENGIALADKTLRDDIKRSYPELWMRIESRRKYIGDVLGIKLSEEVLPLSSTVGYLRPYLLNKKSAFVYRNEQ
jgi:Xaa-Pro aminopeptidase